MKTKIILAILLGFVLIAGVTALSFSDVTKDKFKDKVKKIDANDLCLKEKKMKVDIKKCKEDKIKIKDIDADFIKESKELGMVWISND